MKNSLRLLSLLSFSTVSLMAATPVFAADPIYKGLCVVMTYGPQGENVKILAQPQVQLQADQNVELYNDGHTAYTVTAQNNTYNGKATYDLFLVIKDVKSGQRLATSTAQWYANSATPPLVSTGTESVDSPNQANIQCMQ